MLNLLIWANGMLRKMAWICIVKLQGKDETSIIYCIKQKVCLYFYFQDTLITYPCGSDHTPSPMASQEPVEAEAVLESPSARLTAVAVSMREGHDIAFLGDSKGNLHKVTNM